MCEMERGCKRSYLLKSIQERTDFVWNAVVGDESLDLCFAPFVLATQLAAQGPVDDFQLLERGSVWVGRWTLRIRLVLTHNGVVDDRGNQSR